MGAEGDQDLLQLNAQGSDARPEKIFVSVRLRPLNEKEIECNDFADWECINDTTVVFKNCLGERSMYPNAYNFDRVFGNDCSTKKVYDEAAKEVALSVLNGVNSSVFAYGQTSSGKTFTMSGITQYAVADIYDYVEQHKDREFVMKFSAIEIYNENVKDLLRADPTPLRCLDDPERGTVVERLTEEIVTDRSHLLELIAVCEAQRQTGETSLNETSSRSHQILRLTIESSARQFGGGNSSILTANVNFVDLAGSERTSQTLSTGTRLKEGSHINRSLLTLGKVIRALSKGRNGHVPYRDSKLTRILHNSLGGNARTAIICTMSPAHSHQEQSRNTLLFASCAKEVSTNARVNVVMSDKALVKHLKKELAKLEGELKTMSSVSTKSDVVSILREKELQIEKMDKEIKALSHQRDIAQSRIEELLSSARRPQFSRPQDDESSHHASESREKISWLDDSSIISDTSDYQRLDVGLTTSDSFRYINESDFDYSNHKSDVLEDLDHSILSDGSPPQPAAHATPSSAPDDSSVQWKDMTTTITRTDEDMEDNCKEVRCIEVEDASIKRKRELPDELRKIHQEEERAKEKQDDISKVDEKEHVISSGEKEERKSPQSDNDPLVSVKEEGGESDYSNRDVPVTESYIISSDKKQENDSRQSEANHEALVSEKKEERESNHFDAEHEEPVTDKALSSVKKEEKESHHSDTEYDTLVKRIKELQRTIDCLVNRSPPEQYSSSSARMDRSTSGGLNLNRSRSCKAALTTSASPAFEKVVRHYRDQSFSGFDKELIPERPKGLPRVSDINGASKGNQFTPGFPITIRSAMRNEMDQDDKYSDVSDTSSIYSSFTDISGDANKQLRYDTGGTGEEEDTESKYSESADSARDVAPYVIQERDCMSEGIPSTVQSPFNWHEEFESQRLRIIELWHACHIPLVHRTYFYLLFKGDPSDKLYIELELRRLSFIKTKFDQGQKIVMDGQVLTPSSSMRTLNQEREMLIKQMYKQIPAQERGTLFGKWGISMNSKQRRLQLARRLWKDTKDMQHIRESASLVARLVGFVDEGQVPKEMFVGPSLTPRTILNRRSYSWKS